MKKNISEKGFTLVEVIVSIGVFAVLSLAIFQVYFLVIKEIIAYREQTVIASLADQYLEIARNLPYSKVGTLEGNPTGNLPSLAVPTQISLNANTYKIYYAVSYVDDPSDGTILAGTDSAPNDYKQIKLYIVNTSTNVTKNFLTNVSPKGLEGMNNAGALYIKVFNAVGQPISGVPIHIVNTAVNPQIDITRTSDASGNWLEVGLPISANNYHITATKNGYSTDGTYAVTQQNPNPVKPDATISLGQVTQISFSIDLLSNLTFYTKDQICSAISNVGLGVKGSKLIGTSPSAPKFNNTYASDANGQIALSNIEWDSYIPGLISSDLMVYGSSPPQQVNLLPNTSQNSTLILGPKTTNSLLVIVKDASTSNPIEGATVTLQSTSLASYTITSSAGANGTITPTGSVLVNSGDSQTFTISANSGYVVQSVFVDGSSVGAVSTYTFNNVVANHAIVASFTPNVAWLSGWSYRKKITISNTNVNSDISNFPVLVKITADANMSAALSTGYDIRFTSSDGATLLKYERESWTGGGGSSVSANFWVNVLAINHSVATDFYIYYGNSSATTDWTSQGTPTNAQLVWDSNFKSVWHLPNGATLSANDSTSGNNTGAISNVTATTGQINGGANYSNASLYRNITISSPSGALQNLSAGDYTFEAWVKPSYYINYSYISYMNGEGLVETRNFKYGITHSKNVIAVSNATVATGSFAHLVGTKSGSSYNIYVNGVLSNGTFSNDNGYDNYYTIGGGWQAKTNNEFLGVIDEVRISNAARSADWIKFEYYNQNSANNELSFAGQETGATVYTITASSGINGTITPAGSILITSGANQTFIITANTGYHISNVTVDGSSVGVNNIYAFNNVAANHTISASFEVSFIGGISGLTAGSVWSQQDWSGGSGQTNFQNISKYFFDDSNISNSGVPAGLRLLNFGGYYVSSGYLISSSFDTGTSDSSFTNLTWQPISQSSGTEIKFQIAVNNDNSTWNFTGPDGTNSAYYTVSGTAINSANNSNRYVRYKVFFSTNDSSKTPILTSVSLNYVSGCFTPGQVMFSGLQPSSGNQVIVSIDGYQTKAVDNINISGYNVLEVLLNR